MIDLVQFTPWTSLAGGALIGAAAGLLALGQGRILGASGILGGAIVGSDRMWRLAVIAGLMVGPLALGALGLGHHSAPMAGYGLLIIGGLLVGFGTRLGSGCTSGHGICGLSRLSVRSLVAVMAFMATGFATVFVVRHVLA